MIADPSLPMPKPCVFCRHDKPFGESDGKSRCLVCTDCGARGPSSFDESDTCLRAMDARDRDVESEVCMSFTMPTPKPCQHCGHEQMQRYSEDGATQIGCRYCGARGPRIGDTGEPVEAQEARAIDAWNTRGEGARGALLRDVCALLDNPTTTIKEAREYAVRLRAILDRGGP